MGIGDNIIATGLARASFKDGKLIAFGDGRTINWKGATGVPEMIFRNNPRLARPGQERLPNLIWIPYYKGHRIYNKQGPGHWIWNYDFKVTPGEFYFDAHEEMRTDDPALILLEPNVPNKPCGPNKQWPVTQWAKLANELTSKGYKVRQFEYGAPHRVAPGIATPTFRDAAALLKSARLAILPEGGLHHAAAAVDTRAVVLFGGFTPPEVLGYDDHVNLTGGATACGTFNRCEHCIAAMKAISVEEVLQAVDIQLCH